MENKESFFNRLVPFHSPSTINKIKLAYTLSKWGHQYQVRKEIDDSGNNVRYFEHPRRVAINLMDVVKTFDYEIIVGALCHDLLEDSESFTESMMEQFFGEECCRIVKVLSKNPKEGYLERFFMCKDFRPYIIKASDRLDNLQTLINPNTSKEFQERQIKETEEKYFGLFDRMIEIAPIEYKSGAITLRDKIREEVAKNKVLINLK